MAKSYKNFKKEKNNNNLKKIINQIKILYKLIKSRNGIGFKNFVEMFSFYSQINPIFNFGFYIILKKTYIKNKKLIQLIRDILKKGIGFGSLRYMKPEERFRLSSIIFTSNASQISHKDSHIIENIKEKGYFKLPDRLDSEIVKNSLDYFSRCEYYSAQVYAQSNRKSIKSDWKEGIGNQSSRNFCFKPEDTLDFLNRLEGIDMNYFKQIADEYIGFDSELYGVNTFGTFSGKKEDYVMRIHRDYDDFRFLTFFIAWTKTDIDNGATLYYPKSHIQSNINENIVIYLKAEPGEIYAVDTFGLHAGNKKVTQPRLTSWFRYGNKINLATIQDG